jgi:tetratricopeptide (TPR) repeat protein
MTHYRSIHTADMSATMTASSVALALRPSASLPASGPGRQQAEEVLAASSVEVLTGLYLKGQYRLVIEMARHLLEETPGSVFLHNILGETHAVLKENEDAVIHYVRLLELDPHPSEAERKATYLPNVHNNLSIALKELGFLEEAEHHVAESLALRPDFAVAHNTYGTLLNDRADLAGAQRHLLRAIELNPQDHVPYWNLHSTVTEPDQAQAILELCLEQAPAFQTGVVTLAGMRALAGDPSHYERLMAAGFGHDPVLRSVGWILSLPNRPELHFNRWSVFERAIALSDRTRPFYEFGVWMGDSFRYLMQSYRKGFGFDTFEGLPEDWRSVPKGSYSSFGRIPQIRGAEFIAGEFAETLPRFFAAPRPKAALINFDADLYASTLCALTHARPVIDGRTLLVFDEFIVNSDWEKDEYRALEEFCAREGLGYEVLAVSLYTKQMVCRLTGIAEG